MTAALQKQQALETRTVLTVGDSHHNYINLIQSMRLRCMPEGIKTEIDPMQHQHMEVYNSKDNKSKYIQTCCRCQIPPFHGRQDFSLNQWSYTTPQCSQLATQKTDVQLAKS